VSGCCEDEVKYVGAAGLASPKVPG
jgi:hypothetical protein